LKSPSQKHSSYWSYSSYSSHVACAIEMTHATYRFKTITPNNKGR